MLSLRPWDPLGESIGCDKVSLSVIVKDGERRLWLVEWLAVRDTVRVNESVCGLLLAVRDPVRVNEGVCGLELRVGDDVFVWFKAMTSVTPTVMMKRADVKRRR